MQAGTESDPRWDRLLAALGELWAAHSGLGGFVPFAGDIRRQRVIPHDVPAARLFTADPLLSTECLTPLRDALLACGQIARWTEPYSDTDIAKDFRDRFGCYCIIGEGGPFASDHMAAWVVHMPPHLYYPWHHHPAEEIYLVVAGEARFLRQGEAPQMLHPGQTSFHAGNQPHAMETFAHPVTALVAWRNHFESPPMLTGEDL